MSEKSYKTQVLENIRLLQDRPDLTSEFFQFKKFASQLESFLMDTNTPTPYTIAVHGEWGGGKTSLIQRVYESIKNNHSNTNLKILWFDAWEYERIDPVLSLMQRIAIEYRGAGRKFKGIVKGLLLATSDVVSRKTIGLTTEEIQKYFASSVENIPTIEKQLKNIVGEGRLIVFVDDLDRCIVENALGILKAIKLFLSAEGVIFVIAVDMIKLERAWELRYKGMKTGILEGREHVDKIFQLKLSLPLKEVNEIGSYIEEMASSLPDKERRLIMNGCPSNPRKIKRILNLVYFIALSIEEEKFKEYLPAIIIWSIITTVFPDLSHIISASPNSLVQMSLITYHIAEVDVLYSRLDEIKDVIPKRSTVEISKTRGSKLVINYEDLLQATVRGLEYVLKDSRAFNLLKAVAEYYSIIVTNEVPENLRSTLQRHYVTTGKLISEVIYRAGLIA
jgi:hypothetical protein